MKFFLKWVLPMILAVAVLIEGTSYGLHLTNVADDGSVLLGTTLTLATLGAFFEFSIWFIKRAIKAQSVVR